MLLQDLIKKLDEVTQNSEIVEIRQKEAECELEAARDRVQQQATEILLKASKTHFSPHMDFWEIACEHLHPQHTLWAASCKHTKQIHQQIY